MTASSTAAYNDFFSVILGVLGLAIPCFAFAWDGLVRRRLLLQAFPLGTTLGSQSLLIRRLGGLAIGSVCLLAGTFFVLCALVLVQLGAARDCRGQGALACMGTLAGTAQASAWVWFGMSLGWFLLVWLRMGDPRKRVLVYGVWYHQEKVAHRINHKLQSRGLEPLPHDHLYTLEERVLGLMRARGWLVYGEAWLDGGRKRTAVEVPLGAMIQEMLNEPASQKLGDTERAAIELLLTYFKTQAQHAQHMSPLRLWWVGTGQRGKLGVYGRRAV